MKYQRLLLRLTAAALCAAVAFACAFTGALAADTFYFRNAVTIGSTSNPGNVLISKYQLYDQNDVIRTAGETAFSTSITNLLASCPAGSVNASKDGFFASTEDAENGIVKLVIDVVGQPPAEAIDVMFVLDESGSMAMYSTYEPPEETQRHSNFQYTVPCLNPNHYYKIKYQYTDSGGVPHTGQDFKLEPNDPKYKDVLNTWDDSTFYNEIKNVIAREKGVPFANVMLEKWLGQYDFGAHHYDQDDQLISKTPYKHDFTLNTTYGLTGGYFSPTPANAAQCIDRQLIAKNAIKEMAAEIQTKNTKQSRIGYVSFAGGKGVSVPLSNDNPYTAFNTALNALNGYDNTNYAAGLNEAYRLLTTAPAKPAGRQTYVIFITDGMPNTPSSTAVANAKAAAKQFENLADTTLYCVGIKSKARDLLQEMSTGGKHFKDCNTQQEFEEYLKFITETIRGKAALMVDVLGDAYDLVCDAVHPISVERGVTGGSSVTTKYETLTAAKAAGLAYNDQNSRLQWQVLDADEKGSRLSFFVKLHEDNYLKQLPSYTGSFPTNNGDAIVTYTEVSNENPQGTSKTLSLPNPSTIKIEQSRLTAEKKVDRPNETVLPGEELTYTITLTNTGKFAMNNVQVSDGIPAETEYIPGSGGTLVNNSVTFSEATLNQNASVGFHFKVKIAPGVKDIVNYAMFGTGDAPASIVSGAPACYANLVVNPRPGGGTGINGGGSYTVPQTGDGARLLVWAALLALSALGWAGTAVRKRRKRGA